MDKRYIKARVCVQFDTLYQWHFFLMKKEKDITMVKMVSVSKELVIELNSLFDEEVVESSLSS
jgi:hypothetical protein